MGVPPAAKEAAEHVHGGDWSAVRVVCVPCAFPRGVRARCVCLCVCLYVRVRGRVRCPCMYVLCPWVGGPLRARVSCPATAEEYKCIRTRLEQYVLQYGSAPVVLLYVWTYGHHNAMCSIYTIY